MCFIDLGAYHVLSKPKGIYNRKSLGNGDLKGPLETKRYLNFYDLCFILDRGNAYPFNSGTCILSYVCSVDTVNFYIIFWKECVELLLCIETVW